MNPQENDTQGLLRKIVGTTDRSLGRPVTGAEPDIGHTAISKHWRHRVPFVAAQSTSCCSLKAASCQRR